MAKYRSFLKSSFDESVHPSDQQKGIEYPPLEKPPPSNARLISLISPDNLSVAKKPLIDLLQSRKSRRRYSIESLSFEDLSFLLWSTQGVHRTLRNGYCSIRTVPSAGARHPFETYLIVNRVRDIKPGLYRYLALSHRLYRVSDLPNQINLIEACRGQTWVAMAAVVFVWTVIPYRTEWRYTEVISPKIIALDAGHVCQNLYLACEAIGAGTCAIGAYSQTKIDDLINVDGKEEFTIYLAPVGKVSEI
jgi:SagB-type dehydrogenase family enzyme